MHFTTNYEETKFKDNKIFYKIVLLYFSSKYSSVATNRVSKTDIFSRMFFSSVSCDFLDLNAFYNEL
jgi:hypothetical protein